MGKNRRRIITFEISEELEEELDKISAPYKRSRKIREILEKELKL